MEPSKQDSVSRQSSILKAPKQRQPLQIVATNPSSSESSPTIKIKRRVSFAKNKRIREFCNEVEPKEGLDDSYEEHDLSNTKSSSGNNSTDHPLVISIACEDKENFPIQLFIPTDEFECKEIQAAPLTQYEPPCDNLSQCEIEMDNFVNIVQPVNTEMPNKETDFPNATIYCDDGMDITTSIQPQIISVHVQEDNCYNDTVPVSQTCIEDVPMEITENFPSLCKKIVHTQNTNNNVNFEHNSLNVTEPVSTILGIGHVKPIEPQNTKLLSGNFVNETECFIDVPSEFTSVIPSSTWIRPHNQNHTNDETERFNCKTMEFTEVLQCHKIVCKNKTEGIDNRSKNIMEESLPQKDTKSNTSLKQIQHNEVYQQKNNILCNSSIVKSQMNPKQNVINQINNINHDLLEKMQEKTTIFPNVSMEITEAIPVYNEIKTLPMKIKGIQQEAAQEKTEIFCDQSMELTGVPNSVLHHFKSSETLPIQRQEKTKDFIDTSMDITEIIANQKKTGSQVGFQNEVLKLDTNKTKVFFNTSMEMTEAVPTCHKVDHHIEIVEKAHPRNIQDKTKLFNDNSMEVTEAVNVNKIQKLNQCKNQLVALQNEKTQLFCNISMDMTEAVPVINTIKKSILTTNKSHPEITQDRTKMFYDKSMEITETVLNHSRITPLSKFDSQTIEPNQKKNKFCINASMEMTEDVPSLLSRINKPIPKIHENIAIQESELYCNKSMEITEAVPVYHYVDQCVADQEKNQQEITKDKTTIFQNKSMEVSETLLNCNKSNLSCNSKNPFTELEQEKTKFFFNASMEITEAAPVVNRTQQLRSELENVFCNKTSEQTENFQNKSMEITEAVRNPCSNSYHFEKSMEQCEIDNKVQEKTRVFPNMSVTETIPVNKEIWQCNMGTAILKQSADISINNDKMVQLINLNENPKVQATNSDYKTISIFRDENTKYFNKSMDFTEILPTVEHENVSSSGQDKIPNLITDKAKSFINNSMNITDAAMKTQNSFTANSLALSSSSKDLERLHQYGSVLPKNVAKNVDVQNRSHSISKNENVFNISKYRDKSFHRITTNELNTLCASMNLPTQNYTSERSSTLPNDFISICNDVNVLRDSLQKNSIFHQNFTIGSNINTAMDNNMQITTNVSEHSEKQDDLQIFCNTNCKSIEKNATACNEKFDILPTEMESQKEYSTTDKHILTETNQELRELKLGIRHLQDRNVSNNLSNSPKNNEVEYLNSNSFNNKPTSVTQSNIHSLEKSDTPQSHKISANMTNIRKSCTKRKSTELDENIETAENNLKRLPSDNTDLLIATMGFKTELSHPLVINEKTVIKIPCKLLENDANTLGSYSNKNIQSEGNCKGEHAKTSKYITTSVMENEIFDKECTSLNKGNNSSENREPIIRTESFSEDSMNKLDEIQPPSFLCSDSFQIDSLLDAEMQCNKSSEVLSDEIIQEQINVTSQKICCRENDNLSSSENSLTTETRPCFQKDFLATNNMDSVNPMSRSNNENSESLGKLALFNNSNDLNESMISLINEEDINTDPLAPFLSLTKSIETCEKREDCIWTIRKINEKTVAVDFISRSFVTIIKLNEIDKACIKDIDNIKFISRLRCDSTNVLLKIVHRILLSKLKPDKLLSEYKMYEDVLPLLDYISNEVIAAMNFMFDLERLSALHILNVENERVSFMVSSKRANIILEISLMLKVFNEIGPDDINVTCVLGDIRINDIKQLIVNIKKDSTFLSRYINDVKDYIMLMEESTHMQR